MARPPGLTPTLRTARLVLRPWRPGDEAPFAQLNADLRVMEFFPEPLEPAASAAMAARIIAGFERDGYGLWAVEMPHQTEFAGFIGLSSVPADVPFAPAIEIGWRLAQAVWGQGVATEGAREVLRFARERLELSEIVSMTSFLNVRSQRVMQKIGMTRDPADDFEHPRLPPGHRLRPHVLYRKRNVGDDGLEPPTLSV